MASKDFETGLLNLLHLISLEDGVKDETEKKAIQRIKDIENISEESYQEFDAKIRSLSRNEIFDLGIDAIRRCPTDEVKRIFAWIYVISEVDGEVHVREARFILYVLKALNLDLDEIQKISKTLPSIV
ncbi:MAG: hypothetical protein AAFX87_03585 [Bacteroidota bacterium]